MEIKNQTEKQLVSRLRDILSQWGFLDKQLLALENTPDINISNASGLVSMKVGSAYTKEVKTVIMNILLKDKATAIEEMSQIVEKLKNPA